MLHFVNVVIKWLYQIKEGHKLGALTEAIHMILCRRPVDDHDIMIGFFFSMDHLVSQAKGRRFQEFSCLFIRLFKARVLIGGDRIPNDLDGMAL